ncbi:hypothetical protein ACFQ0M_48520 [Kitasatospora aburaviensis]
MRLPAPRVASLRRAWQTLPPADLPQGPASGVRPYLQVAEDTRALADAARASGRFAEGDVLVLAALAVAAEQHCGRLAVTAGVPVPDGSSRPAPSAALQQGQQVAAQPLVQSVGASVRV